MASQSTPANMPDDRELVITRIFDGPREDVWKMWTEPENIKKWWGPEGFTAPYAELDLREGGKYLYCMKGPDGKEYWSGGVFREVVPMEKIVATDSFMDKDGNIVPASTYGLSADYPPELLMTIMFEDEPDGRTKVTIRHLGHPAMDIENARNGWSTSLDKFAAAMSE